MGRILDPPDCQRCDSRHRGIFCELAPSSVIRLARERETVQRAKGMVLLRQGAASRGIHCIRSGCVKVYRSDSSGRQYISRLAGPGDAVGLACLFSTMPCATTAEVIEPGTICFVRRETILDILKEDSQVALRVMQALSNHLERSEEERAHLALATVRQRLARLLILIARNHADREGTAEEHGRRIRLTLSRGELAELVGTAPETVMRLLREFRETRLVDLNGREMVVRNAPRLLELANVLG